MILLTIWLLVAAYFFVLWGAVGLEMAVGGSIIFVFFAFKVTVTVLLHIWKTRHQTMVPQPLPDPSVPANLDHPPGMGR